MTGADDDGWGCGILAMPAACWKADMSGPSLPPPPAQTRLNPQLTQPDSQNIPISEFPNATQQGAGCFGEAKAVGVLLCHSQK